MTVSEIQSVKNRLVCAKPLNMMITSLTSNRGLQQGRQPNWSWNREPCQLSMAELQAKEIEFALKLHSVLLWDVLFWPFHLNIVSFSYFFDHCISHTIYTSVKAYVCANPEHGSLQVYCRWWSSALYSFNWLAQPSHLKWHSPFGSHEKYTQSQENAHNVSSNSEFGFITYKVVILQSQPRCSSPTHSRHAHCMEASPLSLCFDGLGQIRYGAGMFCWCNQMQQAYHTSTVHAVLKTLKIVKFSTHSVRPTQIVLN